jgi:MFS family permease
MARTAAGSQPGNDHCDRDACDADAATRHHDRQCRTPLTCRAACQRRANQINWVLTSYIVAAAIIMPATGWLEARFGRKPLFLTAVIGFIVTSMLCGAAVSLGQIVVFRLLQGISGAPLAPLSQSVLLDVYPPEQQGKAMAVFGLGVMLGPILGSTLGGWLTDSYSWRWVFYVNVPFGVLCAVGILLFLGRRANRPPAGLARFLDARAWHWGLATFPRSWRAARLVRVARNPDRGCILRARLLSLHGPHLVGARPVHRALAVSQPEFRGRHHHDIYRRPRGSSSATLMRGS